MGDAVEGPGTDDAPIEACVRAGGVETPYCRAGRGATVLLLLDGGPEAWRAEVFGILCRHGRVVRPQLVRAVWRPGVSGPGGTSGRGPGGPGGSSGSGEPGEPAVDRERWLVDLLEGLGLDRPLMVVDPGTHAALEGFRTRSGDQVAGWVVLAPGTLPDPAQWATVPEAGAD